MESLKYKVITSVKQYYTYCEILEDLVFQKQKSKFVREEIALLTLLIEKWDEQHSVFLDHDPIALLKSLMKDHAMKANQLAVVLNVSEGLVSDILHYKKGLSKETIRILSEHFKMNQVAFNRSYALVSATTPRITKLIVNSSRPKKAKV